MRYSPLAVVFFGTCMSSSTFATQYLTVQQAQQAIFPEATQFKSQTVHLSLDQTSQVMKMAGLPARTMVWEVTLAFKGDQFLGYFVADDVTGKFELISYAVGFNIDGSIRQVEIMAYRESHGFEIRSSNWRKQFIGKSAAKNLSVGDGIANISGATLSCTHVTDGVRRLSAVVQIALKQ